jgi:hypothetical protein
MRGMRVLVAACLAACVPLVVFARQIAAARYEPGASYRPRLDAVIEASRVAAKDGPWMTVERPSGFSRAPGLLNDLGMAAVADLWGRTMARTLGDGTLAIFNLAVMAVAAFGLVLVFPPAVRPALVVLLALVPIVVREYRSPDSVALHGSLAAISVALAVAPHRRWTIWSGLPLGLVFFAVHKLRSPYGTYGAAAVVAALALAVLCTRTRQARAAGTIAVMAAAFIACEVPWRLALERRAHDPRIADTDVLNAHNFYNPLVSGIGWSENRWGLKPWDPVVAGFLAERTGQPPVTLETFESERRARRVYFELWRDAPGHLLRLYVSRVPAAVGQYFWLGGWGAAAWVVVGLWAVRAAWVGRDPLSLAVLVAPAMVAAGLVAQIVLIDPRLLYSYPLRFVSALGLLSAAASALSMRRSGISQTTATST